MGAFVTSLLQSGYSPCYRILVCARYFSTGGAAESNFVAEGATNKNQRVNMRKASIFACRQGRCCRHLRLGRAAVRNVLFSRSRDIRPAERATSRANPFLCCQRLRASCLPRALAAFDPGHGSRGGALAEVFGQSATLAMIIPQAMNRSRPIRSNPIMAAMDHDAAPGDGSVAFSTRLAGRSSVASTCP